MRALKRTMIAAGFVLALLAGSAQGQVGTVINYQGQLKNAGQPVNGTIDVRFALFAAETGGSPLFGPVTNTNVTAANGLFTTNVDFGVNPYTADAQRWLQVEVRSPAGGGAFTLIGGRQRLTPAPFSLQTRGLSVSGNNDVSLVTNSTGTRVFGLPQGNFLSTNLLIQAGGTTATDFSAQNGGTLTLRAGNANLSASTAPPPGTSGGNDVVIQAGENTFSGSFGSSFAGNIRFIAGDSGTAPLGNQPERMRIVGENGFVGIGTTNPIAALDVRGPSAAIVVGLPDNTRGGLFLGNTGHGLIRNFANPNDVGLFTTGGDLRFSANTAANLQMSLTNSGSLDIGTRVQIAPTGNATSDGQIIMRRANGTLALLVSGFAGALPGYQLNLINSTGNASIGSFFSTTATNQTTLQADVKNFVEPNPRDASTDIYYASLEGPEAGMYTRGTGTLVNGQAVISLPAHFSDLASSQGLTVIVTPLSADSMGLAVVGKSVNGFQVRELMRGTGSYQFDWEVKAVRKQHLNYEVVRPWTERRIANPEISDAQAWQIRRDEVARSNARAAALEAAATGTIQR